jgi:phage baseplate assembly protein W
MLYTKTIKHPILFDLVSGKTDLDDNVVSINRCLGLLLTSAKGELFGQPDFGSRLYEMLFDQYSQTYEEAVKQEIVDTITKYETRISISTNDVTIKENTDGLRNSYSITIHYVVSNSLQENEFNVIVEERVAENG